LAFSASSTRRVLLRLEGIEGADLFDEAAVARHARVGDDDAVERALLGAGARETDFQGHFNFLSGQNSNA
jgi:hypothetical protein